MINKTNNFYVILTLILVILISSGIVIKTIYNKHSGYSHNNISKLFLKNLNSNDAINKVKKIQIDFNAEKITLVGNNDDKWVILEKGNYPALEQKVKELVFDLANLKIIEPKTTKVENFATLQLDDININKQVTRIVLLDANNQEIDGIYIGKREFVASPNADNQAHIFVRKLKEMQAWLVAGKLSEGFAVKDLVKQPVLSVDLSAILQVELSKVKQPQKSFIKIAKNLTTKELNLLEVPPRYQVKEQYIIDNIVQQFAYLNYEDVLVNSQDAVPVLNGKLVLSQSANTKDVASNVGENPINFELVYVNKNYYFKLNNNNWLYKISDYACQSLLVNKSDLLTEIKKTEVKNTKK